MAGVEQSLVRMKTDYLDLVQFHRSLTRRQFDEHQLAPRRPDNSQAEIGDLHGRQLNRVIGESGNWLIG